MELSEYDRELLSGGRGKAAQWAMEIVVDVAHSVDAPRLVDITQGHIDGCLFHSQAVLDFARHLATAEARVAVPTTLNVSSLDLLHPDLFRGSARHASLARELMDLYVEMGCQPTWTCAPYQLQSRPAFGEQIAWGESNAIVFANSVLGARTERYGDFLDICCAVTGRAPYFGLHTNQGRGASVQFDLDVEDEVHRSELLYPLLGFVLGRHSGRRVPVITGMDPDQASEDRLKALGAAAASAGAVGMFHAVGITPEAPTLEASTRRTRPHVRITVTKDDLRGARTELDRDDGHLGAVSVGTPHLSLTELEQLSRIVDGVRTGVPFYVNTSRGVWDEACARGMDVTLDAFGGTVVTDTCTYVTPIMAGVQGAVMTNSVKWAYYAPGNLGVDVVLGSMSDCVASAVARKCIRTEDW